MNARKSLTVIAAASAAFPLIASAQDAGSGGASDAGVDAGPSDLLYENKGAAVGRIYAELEYEYEYDLADGGVAMLNYDTEVADDFVVPEGDGWSIERVFVSGYFPTVPPTVSNPTPPPLGPPKLNLTVWTSTGGLPGKPVANPNCSAKDVVVDVLAPIAELSYTLPKPCFLSPGHYWLAMAGTSPNDGFFYVNVTTGPAGGGTADLAAAVRSGCASTTTTGLPAKFQKIPSDPDDCKLFDAVPSTGYPNLGLTFGLHGSLGGAPVETDGGVTDAGTSADASTPDGGATGSPDSGAGSVDGGAGSVDGGAGSVDGGAGSVDGGGGETEGGGGCSTNPSATERGLGLFSFAALALAFLRRRRGQKKSELRDPA